MSLKYKIPVIMTGLMTLLTSFNYPEQRAFVPKENKKAQSAGQTPDTTSINIDDFKDVLTRNDSTFYTWLEKYSPRIDEIDVAKDSDSVQIVETKTLKNGVRYILNNGDCIERRGGTLAWRNNNPGCIRYSKHAVELGATGKANGFAVFPDEETGMKAISALLRSDKYCDLTIGAAIRRYAPPRENNTAQYIDRLCDMTGVSKQTNIHALTDDQMKNVIAAIRTIEGWNEGTEKKIISPANQQGLLEAYKAAEAKTKKSVISVFERTM